MKKYEINLNSHTVMQSGDKDYALVVIKENKMITLKLRKAEQYVTLDYSNEILFGDGWNDYIDSFEEGEVIAVRILKIRKGELTVLPEHMYDAFDFEGSQKIIYSIQEEVEKIEKEISDVNTKIKKAKRIRKNLISSIEYVDTKLILGDVAHVVETERKQKNREKNLAKIKKILETLNGNKKKLNETLWHAKNNLKKFSRRYRNAEKRLYPYQESRKAA